MNHSENNVSDDVTVRRDKIAQDMWDSYQRILEAREGDESGNEDDDDDDDEDNNFTEEMLYDDDNFILI